jgi:hypothetical protein
MVVGDIGESFWMSDDELIEWKDGWILEERIIYLMKLLFFRLR